MQVKSVFYSKFWIFEMIGGPILGVAVGLAAGRLTSIAMSCFKRLGIGILIA